VNTVADPVTAPTEIDETVGEGLTVKKTFCRICVYFCGLDVVTDGKKVIRILPDKSNEYNWRDYCLKGGSAHILRDHPKRLRTPMKRVGDRYIAVSYEQAVKEIAAQLNDIRKKHGPEAIATYIGNPGQSSTTAIMFQGAFAMGVGTHNNYTVGSLDQSSFNVVAWEMYGSEMACLIPDIDNAKCILLLGGNPAVSGMAWMDVVPEGWKRALKAKEDGTDLIIVDPRQTPSTKKATTHVTIRPGEDWAFLLGIIKVVFESGWTHQQDCAEANGVDTIKAIAEQASLDELSRRCNVPAATIQDVARRFATAETAVCMGRTGIAHNRNGSLGEWLTQVLNLITGRTDRKGGRFYQPGPFKNTMQLVNKMGPPIKRRSRIGNYQAVGGGYPVSTLPDEILTPGKDQVRALIINSGNPVVSGPDGAKMDKAFKELELLIAIDFFQRESHRHAHWLIPGCHFLEREDFFALFGSIYGEQFVQLGQATIEPLDGIKPEWEFFRDLAVEMKVPFMGIPGLNGVIKASRWVSRLTGNPRHAFNPRWIWAFLVKAFGTVKWKDIVNKPSGFMFGEKQYGLFRPLLQTADKRIQAAPETFVAALKQRLAEPVSAATTAFPLQLVSQRRLSMMNSWLVETVKHAKVYGDYVEINPVDAAARKIEPDQIVKVTSRVNQLEVKARITDEVPAGIVSIDFGWGSRLFDPQGGSETEVNGVMRNLLVSGDVIDELSGVPNLTGTYVNLEAAV